LHYKSKQALVQMATVALPVFRSRVAPVFDYCHHVLLVHLDGNREVGRIELGLKGLPSDRHPYALTEAGATTLICGGISDEQIRRLENAGVRVIWGIVGPVEEVLQAFMAGRLDEPRFRMPGYGDPSGGARSIPNDTSPRSWKSLP
jgi:predicted Fe-Mo cluster-binding NifX family protein